MLSSPSLSELYAANLREAYALAAGLAEKLVSIDDTIARTRETIAASRCLIERVEKQIDEPLPRGAPGRRPAPRTV